MELTTDIKYLQGVGPQRADLLDKELGIRTMSDLLSHYPFRYVDRTKIYRIAEIDGNMPFVQIIGQILSMDMTGEGRGKRIVARLSDGTGILDLVWFQGHQYIKENYKVGKRYLVFGKPTLFNGRYQITHPELEQTDQPQPLPLFDGNAKDNGAAGSQLSFRPYYHTTEKMKKSFLNSSAIAKLTSTLLSLQKTPFRETLTPYIINSYHLLSYDEAIRNIHFPQSPDLLRRAEARLKFEELFYIQLGILRYARQRSVRSKGIVFKVVGQAFNDFYHKYLPFNLTGAQKRVIKEIRADMGSGRQMNRLLQGDVGSGKTLVALLCSLIAIDNGCQAVIMAPTEILAQQHLETIRGFLGDMPIRTELLTGSVKGKARKKILADLADGTVQILVGTHAVIEDAVKFHRLGFVVIDEQHRFGVAQRAKLWNRSPLPPEGGSLPGLERSTPPSGVGGLPHVLVMTATPIPRTLAMTLYGDLDVSVIDELPPGRKPIKTIHQYIANEHNINNAIRQELRAGHQVYIVYPLIEETEKLDMQNLEEGYLHICECFPEYFVSKVHGKMKPADKDAQMQAFASGKTQILVATTVIEVGVNVPNASVMIIMNAERFGLSQLHQLRGRVGRGAEQSYCVLVTKYEISNTTRKRIQIMVDSTDGFEIAEADLQLRGPGDIDGTQQSGQAFDLKIANVARDGQILNLARSMAQQIVDSDPDESNPDNALLYRRLKQLRGTDINWGAIS